jgi:hypothetical protein
MLYVTVGHRLWLCEKLPRTYMKDVNVNWEGMSTLMCQNVDNFYYARKENNILGQRSLVFLQSTFALMWQCHLEGKYILVSYTFQNKASLLTQLHRLSTKLPQQLLRNRNSSSARSAKSLSTYEKTPAYKHVNLKQRVSVILRVWTLLRTLNDTVKNS